MKTNQEIFLTARETAQLLGIGLSSMYKLQKTPSSGFPLPSRFGPHLVRYHKHEILEWAKKCQSTTSMNNLEVNND